MPQHILLPNDEKFWCNVSVYDPKGMATIHPWLATQTLKPLLGQRLIIDLLTALRRGRISGLTLVVSVIILFDICCQPSFQYLLWKCPRVNWMLLQAFDFVFV